MNAREAAAYLSAAGYTCSVGTVRLLVRAGKLRGYRPGLTGKGPMALTASQLDTFLTQAETGHADERPVRRKAEPKPKPVAAPVSNWRERLKRAQEA